MYIPSGIPPAMKCTRCCHDDTSSTRFRLHGHLPVQINTLPYLLFSTPVFPPVLHRICSNSLLIFPEKQHSDSSFHQNHLPVFHAPTGTIVFHGMLFLQEKWQVLPFPLNSCSEYPSVSSLLSSAVSPRKIHHFAEVPVSS